MLLDQCPATGESHSTHEVSRSYDRPVAPIDDAIQHLLATRDRHRRRIHEINQALELLGQTADEELFSVAVAKPTGIRETALAVLVERAGQALDVGAIFTAVLEKGWHTASGNPRNALASTLSKLADAGEIERVGRGQYRRNATTVLTA